METDLKLVRPITEIISPDDDILTAFECMKQYRNWSKNTQDSYLNDVTQYQAFLQRHEIVPTLIEGNRLERVSAWIKHQNEIEKAAPSTINRRVRALSSIYSFYNKVSILSGNHFQAAQTPCGGDSGSLSRCLELEDLKKAYVAVDALKEQGNDIEITFKLLLYTGLRNHACSYLRVENIDWDKQLIKLEYELENSKKKMQLLPLPPGFMKQLKEFIEDKGLSDKDPICYGLKGDVLANKQLNRITDKISAICGWEKDQKVTPHGFRYSISTFFEERGVRHSSIEFILGHSSNKNLKHYLKAQKFALNDLRRALIFLETELETHLRNSKMAHDASLDSSFVSKIMTDESPNNHNATETISLEDLIAIQKSFPDIASKLYKQYTKSI